MKVNKVTGVFSTIIIIIHYYAAPFVDIYKTPALPHLPSPQTLSYVLRLSDLHNPRLTLIMSEVPTLTDLMTIQDLTLTLTRP